MTMNSRHGFDRFLSFKNKEWIHEKDIPFLTDYIYGFFHGGTCSHEMYAYSNYLTKCLIVLKYKRKNNLELKTKLREAICKNKLVNFIEDPDHRLDKCNCGSTYGFFCIEQTNSGI